MPPYFHPGRLCWLGVFLAIGLTLGPAAAQQSPSPATEQAAPTSSAEEKSSAKEPAKLVPLNRQKTILLDRKNRRLVVRAKVVLRQGMLEMLMCKKHTKEHESILAFDGEAKILHAGLLALGLKPGHPVVFLPEFKAPTGPELKIEVVWTDKEGKEQRKNAKRWIRHSIHRYLGAPLKELPDDLDLPKRDPLRYDEKNDELSWYGPMSEKQLEHYLSLSDDEAYQKAVRSFHERTRSRPLQAEFVFTGSQFRVNTRTGEKVYLAESGDVICVANFPSATIDVARRSSAEGQQNLLFEAWTERVPPIGTEVKVVISAAENADKSENADEKEKSQ